MGFTQPRLEVAAILNLVGRAVVANAISQVSGFAYTSQATVATLHLLFNGL